MKARNISCMILASCCLLALHQPLLAQIIPDETLGTERSRVTPQNSTTERIEGGARRGANLFHSFQKFSINEGRSAYFANPAGIENILTRVTGGNPSEIMGTLGVLGNANLFFLNPNGIIFGPNAQLDIQGSFLATTANRFTFPDGSEFSATQPQAPPLLTVSVPLGLQYGLQQPAPLVNAGNLEVGQEQSLTLVGGTVVNTGQLVAPGGQVGVAAVPERSWVRIGTGQLLGWEQVPITDENQSRASTLSLAELVNGAGLENAGIPTDFLPGTVAVSGLLDVSNAEGIGGSVRLLGDRVGLLDANINASAARGGGTVLVGGNYNGQGIVPNASRTYVSQDATIQADALQSGNGGQVIVRADEVTGFYGSISARGASSVVSSSPSDGGFVEVSGKQSLIFQGTVNTTAPNGSFGTLLLDSLDITIADTNGGANDNQLDAGIPGGDSHAQILLGHGLPGSFTLSEQSLENLPAYTNVLLAATRDIIINDLTDTEVLFCEDFSSWIRFLADADGDGIGYFSMNRENSILSSGRNITISGATITTGSINSSSAKGRSGVIALSALGDITIGNLISQGVTFSGDIILTSHNGRISSANSRIVTDTNGAGKAGDINIQARSITFTDGTQVTISTRGEGQGGNLTVNAWDSLELSGTSPLGQRNLLSVETQAAGNAGNLTINTGRLIVRDGAAISASVNREGTGRGGNLTVNAAESVEIRGTTPDGRFPSALAAGNGGSEVAGDLTIETKRLSISNGAVVATSTMGERDGGNLTVNASELVELIGTSADGQFLSILSTDTGGNAKAGNLTINTRRLIVRDGAVASVSTFGQGEGGSLIVNASTSVELSGTSADGFASGLYAQAFATGKAGDLTITTGDLIVQDRAQVTVAAGNAADARVPTGPLAFFSNNEGVITRVDETATGSAGNLRVNAEQIVLNNQGRLLASTASGEGGNIQLEARDLLLMRYNSLISAEARGRGNGGNIDITNTQFIVAVPFEDSDIIANAFEGRGGNIEIEAQGIFGLAKRRAIQGNGTSDIDASSEFGVSGTVTINSPDVDPSRGLAALPTNVVDPSQQIVQSCAPKGERANQFVATGRGGLPLSPDEPLRGRAVVPSEWVTLDEEAQTSAKGRPVTGDDQIDTASSSPTKIVEADGWVVDAKGNVVLVTQSQTTDSARSNPLQSLCHYP